MGDFFELTQERDGFIVRSNLATWKMLTMLWDLQEIPMSDVTITFTGDELSKLVNIVASKYWIDGDESCESIIDKLAKAAGFYDRERV